MKYSTVVLVLVAVVVRLPGLALEAVVVGLPGLVVPGLVVGLPGLVLVLAAVAVRLALPSTCPWVD